MNSLTYPILRPRSRAENLSAPARAGNRGSHLSGTAHPPAISRLWLAWFVRYSRGYIRRHFHALRVSRAGPPPISIDRPLVIYSNHASWWDALVCLALKSRFYPERNAFAPIDASMLERYRFFARLGFFGIEQGTRRGASRFLATAQAVLASRDILALTPQGRFADARVRPVRFAPGLGHLAARGPGAVFVPLALEYVFWDERLPEVLARFGAPVQSSARHPAADGPAACTELFEQELTRTQDALAAEAQARRPDDFLTILRGGAGQGGVYDAWRWLKAHWHGKTFNKEHGAK